MNPTHQDIVAALADCWLQWSGSARPIAADDGIVDWLQDEGWWREIDLMDLRWPVSNYFGVDIPSDEWREFFCGQATSEDEWKRDVAPKITFGRLVKFIQQHLANVSFAPVNIAGKDCTTAGAFFGLRQLAESVNPYIERFGPSTSIRDRLSGRMLLTFWNQLRILTRNSVPPIQPYSQQWRVRLVVIMLYCLALSAAITIAALGIDLNWLIIAILGVYLVVLTLGAGGLDASREGTPPKEIRTFRDLANHVSGQLNS